MYRIHCPNCNHYNYSASRAGKWLCCYCGKDLTNEKIEATTETNKDKNREKLA